MKPTEQLIQSESFNSSNENTNSKQSTSTELFKVEEVKDTPFSLISDNKGVKVIMKNQIVTDKVFETTAEAKKWIAKKPWELILIAGFIYNETVTEYKKTIKDNENKGFEQK